MDLENGVQPIDTLMTQLGLTNANLVKASTEQLSFKMVQKARKGRHLTPNIQEKILTALLKARPELKVKRRDLFHYKLDEDMVANIRQARTLVGDRKISYTQFIDHLEKSGVIRYSVEVASGRVTYFGMASQAHTEEGSAVLLETLGVYDEVKLRSAISDVQKAVIDYAAFLKRIHLAGIRTYEVNIRARKIDYKAEGQVYRESLLPVAPDPAQTELKPETAKIETTPKEKSLKPVRKKTVSKAVKKGLKVSNSLKARAAKKRKSHRVKKPKKSRKK